jgi:transcriptional regulator with XRE-family HTH domain
MDSTRDRILERIRVHRELPTPERRIELRKAAGLSLQEVATAVGVSVTSVWYWERGQRHPSGKRLDAYLIALQTLDEAA